MFDPKIQLEYAIEAIAITKCNSPYSSTNKKDARINQKPTPNAADKISVEPKITNPLRAKKLSLIFCHLLLNLHQILYQ